MKRIYSYSLAAAAFASVAVVAGCNMGQYEEPAYQATQVQDNIELRHYQPVIAAEVEVTGAREESISAGFRLIADYIFGNNAPNQKIAMTAPVVQQAAPAKGESIAMTTPVIQQGAGGNRWKVQFIMPSEYTLATLPKPNNAAVKLREVKGRTMAVIRFSGTISDEKIASKTAELKAYIAANKLQARGEPVLAFYDPPWTLWFLRRNEVMLEIKAN